jgi:hypothetical protein
MADRLASAQQRRDFTLMMQHENRITTLLGADLRDTAQIRLVANLDGKRQVMGNGIGFIGLAG